MPSTPWRRRSAAALAAMAALLAAGAAQAGSLDGFALSALPPDSGSHVYTLPDLAGGSLTVNEAQTATMSGSDFFGFEGLWLGADGTGGSYVFSFSAPVSALTIRFIALTGLPEGASEQLDGFFTDSGSSVTAAIEGSSATWDGSVLKAQEEDSRAALTFTALAPGGFRALGFVHGQPELLQGVVVAGIDYTLMPVPEPATLALLPAGLLMLGRLRRHRRRG